MDQCCKWLYVTVIMVSSKSYRMSLHVRSSSFHFHFETIKYINKERGFSATLTRFDSRA